ncbi:MAG: tetratricopeptide repeat protein, partial [Proteobacteria bacterium]|nr:tetratricopeptide repeat protein [Pseudomonadota bacterium]
MTDTPTAQDLHHQADALYAAGRYAEALQGFRAASALAPGNPVLLFNIGGALRLLGRHAEAIAVYDQALAIDPRFAIAQFNRATCLLQLGDYRGGFQAFEWRKSCPGFDDPRYSLPNQWAGQSLQGQKLFIYPEFFQ